MEPNKILDKSRLAANILLVILVVMNIFFTINYTQGLKREDERLVQEAEKIEYRLQTAQFTKFFIDKVLGATDGTISFEDRVKLEADIVALGDEALKNQWNNFIGSEGEEAEKGVVRLLSMLANRMI
jgi:hypothetical protein